MLQGALTTAQALPPWNSQPRAPHGKPGSALRKLPRHRLPERAPSASNPDVPHAGHWSTLSTARPRATCPATRGRSCHHAGDSKWAGGRGRGSPSTRQRGDRPAQSEVRGEEAVRRGGVGEAEEKGGAGLGTRGNCVVGSGLDHKGAMGKLRCSSRIAMGRPPGRRGQTKARGGGTAPQLSGNEEGRGGKNQQLWGGGGGGLLRLGGEARRGRRG